MKTFAVVLNIPSPYRVHLLEVLNRRLKEKGVRLEVHFMAKGHAGRPKSWLNPKMSFSHKYWRDYGFATHHFNVGLIVRSWLRKPDVLLVGSPFDTFTGICMALLARAKVKCTWIEGQTKTPGKMDGMVGAFKRLIISRFRFVAVPGEDAAKYIALHQQRTKLKMPTPVRLPNLIDETRFRPRAQWPADDIAQCRAIFGAAEEEKVCLIPARLDKVKGLVPFLKAVDANLVKRDWRIVIMGQGPEKPVILEIAQQKGVEDRVTILDYVPYEQMPACYAAADLFLLPSLHDPNPLSVPEALHSGLPVALSDQTGNFEEGVTDGKNGWALPVNDAAAFESKLQKVFSASDVDLKRMGGWSYTHNARFWDSNSAIDNFLQCLEF